MAAVWPGERLDASALCFKQDWRHSLLRFDYNLMGYRLDDPADLAFFKHFIAHISHKVRDASSGDSSGVCFYAEQGPVVLCHLL